MGRLQKKKTENQKIKGKIRLDDDQPLDSNSIGNTGKENGSRLENVKRPADQSRASGTKKAASSANEPGRIEQIQSFLREVKAEMNKVVWPTKNQTVASTLVVIVMVIIVSSFLGLFDFGLKGLIRMVLH